MSGRRLRHAAKLRVEASLNERPLLTLDQIEPGTGRIFGELPQVVSEQSICFQPGDVLFSKLRPYLAKSVHVSVPMHGTGELLALEPNGSLDSRYLFYLTFSQEWLERAVLTSYGSKMPRTSWDAMCDIKVPPVGLTEQRQIADFLDDQVARIDNIIAARRRQSQVVKDQSREAVAGCIEADAIDYGWIPLRRWVTTIDQGWSPLCANAPASTSEAGVLKVSAVRDGEFNPTENKAMLPESQPEPRYRVHAGDLLMSRANTPELVGDCAVVNGEELNLYLPDLLYRVGLGVEESAYVDNALRTPRIRGLLRVIGRGTSLSMAKIRGEDIRALPVPAAPPAVRKERLAEFFKVNQEAKQGTALLQASIQQLEELKRSLITAAVTGEYDVSTADGSRVPV